MHQSAYRIALPLLLSACTASALAAETIDLRMSWWGGNSRHQVTLNALEAFHQQNPDINVKAEYTGWDGHTSRLTTQLAGGTEPDVMQTNWNWLTLFSKDGNGFYDLNKVKDEIGLDQFTAKDLQPVTVKGKLNGIPVAMTARIFYYNDQTWKKAGLSYPQNWDQLMQAGKTFETKLGKQYYPVAPESLGVLALLNSYMVQKYNIPAINEQSKKFSYSDAQWVEFFQLYKTLIDNHVTPDMNYYASFGKGNIYEMKPWIEGEWGGVYMWNTAVTKYSDNLKPPAKLELGGYPMLPGATDAGLFMKPSMMLSIGKTTQHPQAAAKLINFLLNSKEGVTLLGLERGVPLSKSGVETLKASGVINDNDPSVAGIKLALSLPAKVGVSPYLEDPQLVQEFDSALQSIDYGKNFKRQSERILKRAMR